MDEPEQSVSFSQIGGPYPNGDIVQAVGLPLLEVGDYVFLRLSPTRYPVTNNELTVNACTTAYGAVHVVDEDGNDDIADHTVKKSWRSLDVSVADMTRIVRATLKRPNEMRAFERDLTAPAKEARYQVLMEKIKRIERDLGLPEITHD